MFKKQDLNSLYQHYYGLINTVGGQGTFGAINCLNFHYNKILNILDKNEPDFKHTSYKDKHCKYELFTPADIMFKKAAMSIINEDINNELKKSRKSPCIIIEADSAEGPQGLTGPPGPSGSGVLYIGEITRSGVNQMLLNGGVLNLVSLAPNSVFLLQSNQYIVKCNAAGVAAIVDPTDYDTSRAGILANATGPGNCFGIFLPGIMMVGGQTNHYSVVGIIFVGFFKIIFIIIIIILLIYILIAFIDYGLVTKRASD